MPSLLMSNEKSYLEKPEWGIGKRNEGNDGNVGNQVGNTGNQGENAMNQEKNAENQGGNAGD